MEQLTYNTVATGILPFFDDGTVLLGKEYRARYASYSWLEFGGKQELNETLAQAAYRETIEETAGTLKITLEDVIHAEKNGHYIDHINPETKVFYRMYFIVVHGEKPLVEMFHLNAGKLENAKKSDIGKVDWRYFDAFAVKNCDLGDEKLYSTMKTRLEKPETQELFNNFINTKHF